MADDMTTTSPKTDSKSASSATPAPSADRELMASGLPVETHADIWPVLVQGMGDAVKARDKAAPDGRPTFQSGGVLKLVRAVGIVSDKSASVNVINPPIGGLLRDETKYRAVGKVWVMPYESNTRVALSITVESLEEVK